uniref:HDC17792 n=1 Tax=Drosophila melanogaster TaxID=7227 RepID=Q6IIK5_DROME|nr:TPA_inf: HDC17792 [Drosophila melanogaster]
MYLCIWIYYIATCRQLTGNESPGEQWPPTEARIWGHNLDVIPNCRGGGGGVAQSGDSACNCMLHVEWRDLLGHHHHHHHHHHHRYYDAGTAIPNSIACFYSCVAFNPIDGHRLAAILGVKVAPA